MNITYAVTVCNEFIEIQKLVHHLLKNKRVQDDIVILYDSKNGDLDIETFLRSHSVNGESVLLTFYPHPRMILYPESHGMKLISKNAENLIFIR